MFGHWEEKGNEDEFFKMDDRFTFIFRSVAICMVAATGEKTIKRDAN